jgi:hypothetical protein
MGARITLHCGGCNETAPGGAIYQRFHSVNGKGYGFGHHVQEIEWKVPDGWTLFDLIGATYCPKCTAEIWPEDAEKAEATP